MNEQMMKSLVALIDESLAEIEELKKSDRFSASEVKIEGPGTGIAGKPVNGSGVGKADDDDEDDDDKKKDAKKADMDKADGQNRQADPNGGHHVAKKEDGMDKGEGSPMYAGAADGSSHGNAPGVNRASDPNGGHHVAKTDEENRSDDEAKKDKKKEKRDETDGGKRGGSGKDDDGDESEKKMPWMKKSLDEANTLLKSYVDQRLAPIEGKLESIMALVKQVADAPAAPAKGANYRTIAPLKKSDDGETLTKSVIVDKMFELKKSGVRVDSVDIASAELAGPAELAKIVTKYNIK